MSPANLVTVDYYRWLYDYSYWARDRVLATWTLICSRSC